ncbi:hypothetical protein ACOMHN_035076 [Nucella lapillus]
MYEGRILRVSVMSEWRVLRVSVYEGRVLRHFLVSWSGFSRTSFLPVEQGIRVTGNGLTGFWITGSRGNRVTGEQGHGGTGSQGIRVTGNGAMMGEERHVPES